MHSTLARVASFLVFFALSSIEVAAETTNLARIFFQDKAATPVIGEIVESRDDDILVFDLAQGSLQTLRKDEIREIRHNLSEEGAADRVGPSRLLAWKIKKAIPLDDAIGQIATVDGATVYINLGKDRGLAAEQQFAVFRGADEVRDPATNELLDRVRRRIGTLTVVEVRDRIAKCRHHGDVEATYKVGDEVEALGKRRLAVFPIRDPDGAESSSGNAFTESLISDLTDANVPLVDRTRLDDALTELALQRSGVFDEASVQKICGLLGATSVVVGSLDDRNGSSIINARVLNVATGEVEMAYSSELPSGKFMRQKPEMKPSTHAVDAKQNLLANATIDTWQRKGDWKLENGKLNFKGGGKDGMITFPSPVPSQFQLTVNATPSGVAPATCVAFYFKAAGAELIVQLAEDGSCVIADGKDPRSDRTAKYGPIFLPNRGNVIFYQVREGLLDVKVNGKSILRYRDVRLGKETSTGFSLGVVGDWTIEVVDLDAR